MRYIGMFDLSVERGLRYSDKQLWDIDFGMRIVTNKIEIDVSSSGLITDEMEW